VSRRASKKLAALRGKLDLKINLSEPAGSKAMIADTSIWIDYFWEAR